MDKTVETTKRITVRKSGLIAENTYELHKLCYQRQGFLSCSVEEDKEEVHFTFDITGMQPFENIKQEKRNIQLIALMDICKLAELRNLYQFSLKPSNLYYDIHQNIFVMERDIYARGDAGLEEDFLVEYKALIGYVLQKKYSYEDYLNGGIDLLKKQKFLQQIYDCATSKKLQECLLNEHDRVVAEIKDTKIEVPKKKYTRRGVGLVVSLVCLVLAVGYSGYCAYWVLPYQTSVMQADNAYLEDNYTDVIDALKEVDISRLDKHQKYMLAESYVKGENLTDEQRKNILAALSVNGDAKVMDYWIYIGRLEPQKAADIALQVSDNQMLLYAYLKQKYLIEIDSTITGEEKSAQLTDIEGKIESLSQEYEKPESEAEPESEQQIEEKTPTETSEDNNEEA